MTEGAGFVWIAAAVLAAGAGLVLFWIRSEFMRQNESLRRELDRFNRTLTENMSETRRSVQTDLKSSGELMAHIHSRLGELGEASKRIHEVGENISGLQDLLRAPKLRGGMGEYFLEDLLQQIIPRRFFKMQHTFKNGCVVDAIIRIGESMVCIDSKFPLETFRQMQAESDPARTARLRRELGRAVKKHVDDISSKYILPAEGTYDFALMYIPAENVYYETIVRDPDAEEGRAVFEYAVQKKVIPVSPNSIYAYLQVILIGLKGFEVEKKTAEILAQLAGVRKELGKFEAQFQQIGRHLGHTAKKFDEARVQLGRLGGHVHLLDAAEGRERPLKREVVENAISE